MARGRRDGIVIAGGGLAGVPRRARHGAAPARRAAADRRGGRDVRRRGLSRFRRRRARRRTARALIGAAGDRALAGLLRRLSRASAASSRRDWAASAPPTSTGRWSRRSTPEAIPARHQGGRGARGRAGPRRRREIKAEGAIDARGAANLSTLDLLYEARLERDYRFKAPHRVDRPVLIDATVDQAGGLRFMQCVPLAEDRLIVADVCVSERAQPDEQAGGAARRLCRRRAAGGKARATASMRRSRPLPIGGDFAAFWRLGGARVAKLGLRGGFVHPADRPHDRRRGRAPPCCSPASATSRARRCTICSRPRPSSCGRSASRCARSPRRFAARRPEERRALLDRLYGLDPGLIARLHADRLGLIDRMRVQRALRGG